MNTRRPEYWRLVRAAFHAARRLPPDEREGYLADACEGDDDLLREVRSLLAHDDSADEDSFLARSALGAEGGVAALGDERPERSDEDSAPFLLPDVPGYRLLRLIGSGGSGAVFEADQLSPPRRVAVKLLRMDVLEHGGALDRFEREARLLARVDHPGVVRILQAGRASDGRPFLAMELVEGRALNTWVAERAPSHQRTIRLFVDLCRAVHAAHLRGIIHRDLKPANILVDADGRPRILDFGLAIVREESARTTTILTRTGQLSGTLPWMSPEQAAGRAMDADARSDVYAIGVMLYESLTGSPPYDLSDSSLHEAVRIICEQTPRRPSALCRALPADIDAIAMKALEKVPERRYGSADAMAEDLLRLLDGRPVLARPPSTTYLFRRFVARHRLVSVLSAALLTAVVIFSIVSAVLAVRFAQERTAAQSQRDEAQAQQARAERERERSEALAYRHSIALARLLLERRDGPGLRRVLNECAEERRGWEWAWLAREARGADLTLEIPGIRTIVVLPVADDETGAHRHRVLAAVRGSRSLDLICPGSGDRVAELAAHDHVVSGVAVDPTGTWCAAGTRTGYLLLWRIDGRTKADPIAVWQPAQGGEPMFAEITDLVFDASGSSLAVTGLRPGGVESGPGLVVGGIGSAAFQQQYIHGPVHAMAFLPDDSETAVFVDGRSIGVMDHDERRERRTRRTSVARHDGPDDAEIVHAMVVHPVNQMILTGHGNGRIRKWHSGTLEEVGAAPRLERPAHRSDRDEPPLTRLLVDPLGAWVAAIDTAERLLIIDSAGDDVSILPWSSCHALVAAPDGSWLCGIDRRTGRVHVRLMAHRDRAVPEAVTSDRPVSSPLRGVPAAPVDLPAGRGMITVHAQCAATGRIAAGTDRGTIITRDGTGGEFRFLGDHRQPVLSLAFTPDGSRLASLGADRMIRLWNPADPEALLTLASPGGMTDIWFSDDGRDLIVRGPNAEALRWTTRPSDPQYVRRRFLELRGGDDMRRASPSAAPPFGITMSSVSVSRRGEPAAAGGSGADRMARESFRPADLHPLRESGDGR